MKKERSVLFDVDFEVLVNIEASSIEHRTLSWNEHRTEQQDEH